ncbi:MAG: class I SAM-dependent methyltransferase [Planctomycetes bacterium]|nr:class I SAM-dependent methyltransferase [Planctomycetota bacterium]
MDANDSELWRARVLAGGDTPARRAIFERHFAAGPPRKLRVACARLGLDRRRGLDLGCGYGVYLARFGAGSVGLDADAERVAFVRSLGLDARETDLERAGWSAGLTGFDFVWACDILPHVREPARLLAEAARTLAPGGELVVSDWLWPRGRVAKRLALALPDARGVHDEPTHHWAPTRAQLGAWAREADLVVVAEWLPSFTNPLARAATAWFWPPRTVVLRPRG